MVSINNINNSKDNYENFNHQEVSQEEKTLISIFNTDDNKGVFSIQEQKNAYQSKIEEFYNDLKSLLDNAGFKLQDFINKVLSNIKQDISLSGELESEIAELNLQKGLRNVKEDILEIANEQYKKETEELINRIEAYIEIELLKDNADQKYILELYNNFGKLINPDNNDHQTRNTALWESIVAKFPSDN